MKTMIRSFTAERTDDGLVVLSTETPCPQDGLILAANGWDLSRFAKVAPKMFYNHATSWGDEYPIGRWEDVQVKDGKLMGRPVFAADEHPERAGVVAKLWESRFLDDVSVSFRVNGKSLTGPVQADGRDYMVSTSHELLECSVVGIGADQNAGKGRIALAIARGILTRAEADAFDPEASPTADPNPTSSTTEDPHAPEVAELREEIASLRSVVDRLCAMIERAVPPATPAPDPAAQPAPPEPEAITLDMDAIRTAIRESLSAAVRRNVERTLRGKLPD